VEQGRHEELWQSGGEYRRIYEIQFRNIGDEA
jgi:ABC-type multidrug transport system fused ATPase/permease subunit